jgi:hypothetical protein
MIKITVFSTLAGALLGLMQSLAPAQAQATRTFVSSKGNDANACSRAAPCRSFAGALAKTNSGGEINVLDAAGYGALTIDKAISIVNDGVGEAGVQAATGATAITINAGTSDLIQLRGLTIDGAGVAANGIQFIAGNTLTIVNCVVRNFAGNGIYITPYLSMAFFISRTLVSDNSGNGISFVPTADLPSGMGVISEVKAVNNGSAIVIDGSNETIQALAVDIVNSIIANNASFGIKPLTSTGHLAPIVRLDKSVVTGNGTGITNAPFVYSYLDNKIDGNTPDLAGGNLSTLTMR